jgi:predicted amidohydrolase YtcJ
MPRSLALLNGHIRTGGSPPWAEALLLQGGRIVAVGSTDRIRRQAAPNAERIDLDGHLVLPGFHDSHLHFTGGALQLDKIELKDAPDEGEFGRRLQEEDRRLPPGRWMTGGRWDHDRTFRGGLPTAAIIDRHVRERPVFLRRYDGHMAVCNSRALALAGITAQTRDPPGGRIMRDPASVPTGILQDEAMGLVWQLIPPAEEGEVAEAMRRALREAARAGITTIHDMMGGDAEVSLRAYERLARSGDLTARVALYWPLSARGQAAEVARNLRGRPYADRLQLPGVKAFLDGSLGSGTAWFFDPYRHEPDHCGFPVERPDDLGEALREADQLGLQTAVHAIGDRAVAELLTIWERLVAGEPPRDRRLRMEHAQHVRAADLSRFARLGTIPSMQPYHLADDGRWAEERIGAERCAEAFAFRSLLDCGVRLAFGSDWPVAPLDPLQGMDAAVSRRTLDGRHAEGWHPEQRISMAEALCAFTTDAAYAIFREKDLGSLEPGKLADLVVLSRDITDPALGDAITETKVALTMLGGRVVYGEARR